MRKRNCQKLLTLQYFNQLHFSSLYFLNRKYAYKLNDNHFKTSLSHNLECIFASFQLRRLQHFLQRLRESRRVGAGKKNRFTRSEIGDTLVAEPTNARVAAQRVHALLIGWTTYIFINLWFSFQTWSFDTKTKAVFQWTYLDRWRTRTRPRQRTCGRRSGRLGLDQFQPAPSSTQPTAQRTRNWRSTDSPS